MSYLSCLAVPFQLVHRALVARSAIRKFVQRLYERSYEAYMLARVYAVLKYRKPCVKCTFEDTLVLLIYISTRVACYSLS